MARILVAEDERVLARTYERFLPRFGHEVTLVEDGRLALDQLESGYRPDVLISDERMLEMDGVELFRQVYERGDTFSRFLVPGNSDPDLYRQVMDYGAAGMMLKPVTPKEIAEVIDELLDPQNEGRSAILDRIAQERKWVR